MAGDSNGLTGTDHVSMHCCINGNGLTGTVDITVYSAFDVNILANAIYATIDHLVRVDRRQKSLSMGRSNPQDSRESEKRKPGRPRRQPPRPSGQR